MGRRRGEEEEGKREGEKKGREGKGNVEFWIRQCLQRTNMHFSRRPYYNKPVGGNQRCVVK